MSLKDLNLTDIHIFEGKEREKGEGIGKQRRELSSPELQLLVWIITYIRVWKALRGNHMKAKEEKHSIDKVTLANVTEQQGLSKRGIMKPSPGQVSSDQNWMHPKNDGS